jgi:phage tail sheath protein FI
MASTYKTPGVYVEEISKLPPSVAPVATAVPAFIGYTERATKDITGDLMGVPTRITAIAEYERYFGGPFQETGFVANVKDEIDPNGVLRRSVTVPKPTVSAFNLYYSIRWYFANGGGPCYIIPVDTYTRQDEGNVVVNNIDIEKLGNNTSGTGGLDLLELEDEPTLIVCPDAQALTQANYFSFCQAVLKQCNKLQDRFGIFDTQGTADTAPAIFRNFIGTNFLKYGAVYYPFINTSYVYSYDEDEFAINQDSKTTFASIIAAITDKAVGDINDEINKVKNAQTTIQAVDAATLSDAVTTKPAGDINGRVTELAPIKTAISNTATQLDTASASMLIIEAKTEKFNERFSDPDIVALIDTLKTTETALTNYKTKLKAISGRIDKAVDDHAADATKPPTADLDQIAIDFEALMQGGAANLQKDVKQLTDQTLPGLITALQGNNPVTTIADVNDAYAKAIGARAEIVTVKVEDLVNGVKGAAVSDAQALTALKNDMGNANDKVLGNIKTVVDSLLTIQTAVENISEIIFLKNMVSTVEAVNTTTLLEVNDALVLLKADIGNASGATARANLNELADVFAEQMASLSTEIQPVFTTLLNMKNAVSFLDISNMRLSGIKNIDNTTYNQIKIEADKIPVMLPPSPAVAGLYAQVDRDSGVWKAPANVSLSDVIGPVLKITNDIQDDLNVDVIAGKSVNAIRAFTGRGTLIWGGRTLAGNDNEWRYVSVRRFFIFVEESSKKSTGVFVFEPNDANTWVKVKAMLENFLTVQWRQGALAGAKPADAFFVKVGIGETMTALDILEGRMIIEIGMAVVRPAEFIILRFSHKMQES